MAVTTEIAPNVYRISIFAQQGSLHDCTRALDDLNCGVARSLRPAKVEAEISDGFRASSR